MNSSSKLCIGFTLSDWDISDSCDLGSHCKNRYANSNSNYYFYNTYKNVCIAVTVVILILHVYILRTFLLDNLIIFCWDFQLLVKYFPCFSPSEQDPFIDQCGGFWVNYLGQVFYRFSEQRGVEV